jgi:flagellar protein FliL
MKSFKRITVLTLFGLVAVVAGGAAVWWVMAPHPTAPKAAANDTRDYKYLSLDKVIVMLRKADGEAAPHYLAVDLVFKTPNDSEKVTRDHLPLLRSVTVKALSNITMEDASRATVEDLTKTINKAFTQTYANDRAGKPFAEAMIGKLIIE